MTKVHRLRQRLDELGQVLARTPDVRALLGLGSSGAELDRLDDYSDLDFFVVVAPGSKPRFLASLDWLDAVHPLAYAFRNTEDGYKALFADGVLCEFAVFERAELAVASYTAGRVIWQHPDEHEPIPAAHGIPAPTRTRSLDWLANEALTNLYVGLERDERGETLSAMRFIQHYAVDRVLEMSALIAAPTAAHRDPFAPERRYEQRFPDLARHLPDFARGYRHNRASALAILTFLEQHATIAPVMADAIRQRCQPDA